MSNIGIDMKKILITVIMLVLVQSVLGAQDPGLVFCQLQGYDAVFSVIIQYEGKDIQFIPGNQYSDETIFPLSFRRTDGSGMGYFHVKEIYGLSESEKTELIQQIENENNFDKYTVKKDTETDKYGHEWWYLISGDFEVFTFCNFPEGHDCEWTDFRDKKCGTEYLKNIPCVGEEESIRQMFQECCEGLEVYNPRPDCEGCLPICRSSPTNIFVKFWEWFKGIF
jgi:hypothetical protein